MGLPLACNGFSRPSATLQVCATMQLARHEADMPASHAARPNSRWSAVWPCTRHVMALRALGYTTVTSCIPKYLDASCMLEILSLLLLCRIQACSSCSEGNSCQRGEDSSHPNGSVLQEAIMNRTKAAWAVKPGGKT